MLHDVDSIQDEGRSDLPDDSPKLVVRVSVVICILPDVKVDVFVPFQSAVTL